MPKFGIPKVMPSADDIKAQVAKHYKTVKVLAELEANELRDTLIKALKGACETADEGISLSNRRGAEATIWRTIDDEEIGVIADYLIEQGKQHAAAAALVRSTVDLWKRWNIALILGPRVWDTGKFYADNGGFGFGGGRAS